MPLGVELVVETRMVELLNLPGVRGTGFTVKEVDGPLVTVGVTVALIKTLPGSPRLPRVIVVFAELPATTLMEDGFAERVKLPRTVMLRVTECFRAPLAPATVTR